jgi:hypothetical protein
MTEMMTQRMRLKEMKNSCTLQSPVCYRENQSCASGFIESGSGSSISSESGYRADDQKLKKKLQLKFFSYLFLIKNRNLLMPKLQEKPLSFFDQNLQFTYVPATVQEKPSAPKENIQHFKK